MKQILIALLASSCLAGCTTITTTGPDGAVTKTTAPVVSLWDKGFDIATTIYNKETEKAVAAPTKWK